MGRAPLVGVEDRLDGKWILENKNVLMINVVV
jgi:hypothetical protein